MAIDFPRLHAGFEAPIAALDCGERCAPYNEGGAPFCCDTQHTIPSAYLAEWDYLQVSTDLWHAYLPPTPAEAARLESITPPGQVLIECQGHTRCQRGFRAITCRAFPFFPYLNREGQFLGLAYYYEYEERCWVISHLEAVTPEYIAQFVAAFEALFAVYPDERESFRQESIRMRRVFGRGGRAIPLLHRNGKAYKVTPRNGRLRRVDSAAFPLHGPYLIASQLPFTGEE
jgi:hypothetical protein